ncbi:putative reverse transcriptase domain-containing protein [Tanacetum coccineum]
MLVTKGSGKVTTREALANNKIKSIRCNFYHIGQCAEKCGNCKWRGHQARDCRILVLKERKRSVVSGKKAEVICYGCGGLGHYKRNCLIVKFQNRVDMRYDQEGYTKGEVRDRVLLKVSPWKGVVRFGKRGKLNPIYVGPFKVLAKVGAIAYKLQLPQELSGAQHMFHVSNLKKCFADEQLTIPLDGLHIDDKIHFVEEPLEIMDHEVK